jgi:hypothetical protein
LIGLDTVTNAHRLLRAKNYANAYKHTSIKEWNEYIVFGIQQFESPAKYFAQCDAETPDEKNLRLARYYKLHLENNVQADRHLMKKITTVESALTVSYPGYFEMSVGEMDEYIRHLSPDPMELESPSESHMTTSDIPDVLLTTQSPSSLLASSRAKTSSVTSPSMAGTSNTCRATPLSLEDTTTELLSISDSHKMITDTDKLHTSKAPVLRENNNNVNFSIDVLYFVPENLKKVQESC